MKECRNVLELEEARVPDALTKHKMPRCQVGRGKGRKLYQWTDDAQCVFLGGTKVFQKSFQCKDGEEEQWREVEVCVEGAGAKLSATGLNYVTGQAEVASVNFQPVPKAATEP
jgi:hypothetical protein